MTNEIQIADRAKRWSDPDEKEFRKDAGELPSKVTSDIFLLLEKFCRKAFLCSSTHFLLGIDPYTFPSLPVFSQQNQSLPRLSQIKGTRRPWKKFHS
ncbi:hypothetical protein CDAR_620931 [Caerostris darwini]|uniref:Uncharacterized protein n=1 Tax=Caerostris darwini TaxID=1538125 RepID=A0AAV4USV5_9ARAC|nr:hypothetical protein CDAR_620931 [Caerostris darwini]